jgi:gliding motility-associated-like protein
MNWLLLSLAFVFICNKGECGLLKPANNSITCLAGKNVAINEKPHSLLAIGPPDFRCVSVNNAGDVELTWLPVNDPLGTFLEYRIYSANAGVFNLVGSETNITNTTFIDLGANANLASVLYYISTVSNPSGSIIEEVSIDTLATIFLDVVNPSNGTAVLQWNSMVTPQLATSNDYYYVYMEYPLGTWILLDSVPNSINSYSDTITICDAFLNFRIGLSNQQGCISFSNVDGDQFQDMLPPDVPQINYVTVDTLTGNVYVDWESTFSQDTYAYIIFQNINGVWIVIDTVYGYNNTNYLNSISSNSSSQVDNYGIAAYDSCITGNPNTSPVSTSHNTLLLSNELDVCDLSIELTWNSYLGWQNGVDQYKLFYSKDNGPWTLLAQLGSSVSSYLHENLDGLSAYRYLIEANENGLNKSLSNFSNRFVYQPTQPAFSYLKSVNVISNDLIEIEFHSDNSIDVYGYDLYRSDDDGVSFNYIDFSTSNLNPIVFQDDNVTTDQQSYQYFVSVIDSCNREVIISNISNSILLNAEADNGLTNALFWNSYNNWDGNVNRYELFRKVNDVYESTPFVTLGPSDLSYEDDISSFLGSNASGQFCYKVKAVEQTNSFGFSSESYSNEFCANQDPIIFAPNSFTPNNDGINDRWKPLVNLLDFSDYRVYVYNRLNHLVFESSNSNEYWDGSYINNGKIVPIGVYLYFVEFKNGRGDFLRRQGHITLIE